MKCRADSRTSDITPTHWEGMYRTQISMKLLHLTSEHEGKWTGDRRPRSVTGVNNGELFVVVETVD